MMQEEIEQKSVALVTNGAKMTAHILARAMENALRKMRRERDSVAKMSAKELAESGSYENIEISEANIAAFEPIARKHGVQYKLTKDDSVDPPKWLILFKSKDADAMTAAFKEFAQKTLKHEAEKPSTRETMRELREVVKNAVIDRSKHKDRSGPEL